MQHLMCPCVSFVCTWNITNYLPPFLCTIALPPPPPLDEETSANYFNLDPNTSPAVMNITLPPPPGINPPPPGKHCVHLLYLQLFTKCHYHLGRYLSNCNVLYVNNS